MYLLKPGNKKSIIAAVGLTGILLLILLIFIVIIPEYRITKMERAVSKLIRDANREIGMDYIKINNIREQCRDMIEQDKLDSGRSVLHVSYVNLQNLYVPEIKLPRYDINQTTENGLKQMHSKEAISQIKKNAKKNPPPDGKDSLNIYIGKNNIRDIAASVSSATIQSLKQEADTAMKNKCENLYYKSEDYIKMSIIRKFRDSIQNDSVGGLFDDLHITGIEKQKDGKYAVGFDYYPAKLFTEAITLGYKEFDAAHKPPYFGALPENEVKSAFLSGVSQRKTDRTPENKRLAIPAGDDMGSEYQSFISEIHQLYAQSLQQIKKLLNRKFLVAGKPMPNSKVISGKRAGSPITIRANRRHVWLRFYRIPNKNIKQKGKLALSCIVKKDKTLHINLPAGYYKLIQADAGPSTKWYGTQYGFATSGSYRRWDDAIRIRPNLVYTLTTGISKGNASSSAVPWDQ